MRVAILTEGDTEYACIPLLRDQILLRTSAESIKVMKLAVQPDGPPAKIARTIKSQFFTILRDRYELVIVLLDREAKTEGCGAIASRIKTEITRTCGSSVSFHVSIKDRTFENWIVADLDSLRAQPRRYSVDRAMIAKVQPDKADHVDALSLLKVATIGRAYEKVADGKKCAAEASISRMAKHSRSVRHFLHLLGDVDYATQCKRPV